MEFYKILELWYLKNKRDLPWRKSANPYFVWLSEIILQQTRIQQGLEYYHKFTNNYPTVQDLANATEDEVLKDWQGLGYYSRARNLHFSAKYISDELKGVFPTTYKDLLKLKGVGDYTASAVASICYNEKAAVVDGNVYRVLSRYFNIDLPINSPKGIKYFKNLAQELIKNATPRDYNQALMDFGSMVCKPKNPNCDQCPLNDGCLALAKKEIENLPVKEKKIKVKNRYLNFLVFNIHHSQTVLEKRTGKGIWQNLFQFPLYESSFVVQEKEIRGLENLKGIEVKAITLFNDKPILHKLTHQNLYIQFWEIESTTVDIPNKIEWGEIFDFAVPKPIQSFIELYRSK